MNLGKMVCVGQVVDEFGEFYIYRKYVDIKVPKQQSEKFTGKGIATTHKPKDMMIFARFIINHQMYYILKKIDTNINGGTKHE